MKCRIELLAGAWAGITGWSLALAWWLDGVTAPTKFAAPVLLVSSTLLALGAMSHSRYGSVYGLAACLLAAPFTVGCGLLAGAAGPFLLAPAIFAPVLAMGLSRRPTACASPRLDGVVPLGGHRGHRREPLVPPLD